MYTFSRRSSALLRHPPSSSSSAPSFLARRHLSVPSAPARSAAAAAATAPPAADTTAPSQSRPLPTPGPYPLSNPLYSYSHRTVLPTPLPLDEPSTPSNDAYYPPSASQELLAVMDACLAAPALLSRARTIFKGLRERVRSEAYVEGGFSLLDVRVYNRFLERYLQEAEGASSTEVARGWLDQAWDIFKTLESGAEGPKMDAETWSLMLKGMLPHMASPLTQYSLRPLLAALPSLPSKPSLMDLLTNPAVFTSDEQVAEAITALSRAAADEGRSDVVAELAQVYELGKGRTPGEAVEAGEAARIDVERGPEVRATVNPAKDESPFNLLALREALSPLAATASTLADDPSTRQKLLEESAYETARKRFEHEVRELEKAGVQTGLGAMPVQKLMWDWLGKVELRIRASLAELQKVALSGRRSINCDIYPFLSLLSPDKLALIVILEIMRLSGTGGVAEGMKTTRALITTGRAVEAEYHAEMLKKKHGVSVKSSSTSEQDTLSDIRRKLRQYEGRGKDTKREQPQEVPPVDAADSARSPEFTEMLEQAMGAAPTPALNEVPDVAPVKTLEDGETVLRGKQDIAAERAEARLDEERLEAWTPAWTQTVRARVGGFLVDALMETATVVRSAPHPETGEIYTEEQPAFSQSYQYIKGRKLGVIKLNPAVADRLDKDPLANTIHPRHLPMLVKPKPWLRYDSGGYLFHRNIAMRFKDSAEQLTYLRRASEEGTIEPVLAGLDVLGATPWRVNKQIYDVVIEAWNKGEAIAKIPPAISLVEDPVKPDNYLTDPKAKNAYLARLKAVVNERRNNHSLRCDTNYKLEIARAFLGETMYFPHSLDFRGRAYPIPPLLNHMGDDLCRGLLTFAEKRPLEERGFKWIKIQLANLYGYDKASFDERIKFAEDHIEDVFDSADKPLEGRRWWLQADDPWQCLATCFELAAAVRSGNPLKHESSLPVHQDGTCNGLQHYAALGGDQQGARQVNLSEGDRPSDVYTAVADLTIAEIEKDREAGNEHAAILQGKITRKVVKQTVMTTVYGVTFVGAREQIDKQLRDRGDIPADQVYSVAAYLAKKVLRSIGDLFSGAKAIQTWLNNAARLVAKSIPPERLERALEPLPPRPRSNDDPTEKKNRMGKEQMTSVIWTTPLGLPIVQPYRKAKKKQVTTLLQSVYIADPNAPSEVNPSKQASAFPPNFIHSLDATHMILTALQCRQHGLTYASVHDSYWTHASTVDQMSEIIRDTFVKLHTEDILGRLREEFIERYKGYRIPLSTLGAAVDKENPAVMAALAKRPRGRGRKPKAKEAATEDELFNGEEEDHEGLTPEDVAALRPGGLSKEDEANLSPEELKLRQKFVRVEDVLPPLPQKGEFDVRGVVSSPYFFS